MPLSAIIFDLDGTLVDSAPGVTASLSYAFNENNIEPSISLTSELIGPPLRETLRLLCPNADHSMLERLSASFRSHYDSFGYLQTISFPGVEQMLRSLSGTKYALYIATNKRQQPTLRILNALGWTELFDRVVSPDSVDPALPSKSAILSHLLSEAQLDPNECLYIGDRLDDYKSAMEIRTHFALAEWGFEGVSTDFPPDTFRLQKPDSGVLSLCLAIHD